ncbi:MAG: head GIN domain-containing protein [Saprospiraceae bacterium]|nr:head GIN domain-containing protein [Saprospiraceae bacterium]
MKTKMLLVLAIASALFFTACEDEFSTEKIDKTFDLSGFTEIDLGDAFEIEITKGETYKVNARGNVRDINDLQLRVQNGRLTGKYESDFNNHKRTEITIQLPELEVLRLTGATKTKLYGFENTSGNQELELYLGGASELEALLDLKFLKLHVEGASEITLDGVAKTVDAEINGASRFYGSNFYTETIHTDISGVSKANVRVSKELKGNLSGNSELNYLGNPDILDVEVSGNSKLRKL